MFNPGDNLSAAEMLWWSQQMAAIFNDRIEEEDDRTDPSFFFKEGIRQMATEAIVLVTSLFPQVFTRGKLN
jgi:hypothetical protein